MTETLFLSLASRAKQIIAWLMVLLSFIGVIGIFSFFQSLPNGFEVASQAAKVSQGITLLYICCIFFSFGGMYHFTKSTSYKRKETAVIKEDEGTLNTLVKLPSGVGLNLHADPNSILTVIRSEDLEKNREFWKELLGIYGRSPFKKNTEYNKVRTFLLNKTKK